MPVPLFFCTYVDVSYLLGASYMSATPRRCLLSAQGKAPSWTKSEVFFRGRCRVTHLSPGFEMGTQGESCSPKHTYIQTYVRARVRICLSKRMLQICILIRASPGCNLQNLLPKLAKLFRQAKHLPLLPSGVSLNGAWCMASSVCACMCLHIHACASANQYVYAYVSQ